MMLFCILCLERVVIVGNRLTLSKKNESMNESIVPVVRYCDCACTPG